MPVRDDIVMRLVLNAALSASERASLGGFVTREEIVRVIERELQRIPRFPVGGRLGLQIHVTSPGARLVSRRFATLDVQRFETCREAIGQYIDLEFGPSCGGVPIKG
jgi:hypothetical protein